MHPLVNDLDNLTDPQIEEKIFDLQRKYFQAHNPALQEQVAAVLDVYRDELSTRRAIAAKKQQEQLGDNGKDLDNLINIS